MSVLNSHFILQCPGVHGGNGEDVPLGAGLEETPGHDRVYPMVKSLQWNLATHLLGPQLFNETVISDRVVRRYNNILSKYQIYTC